MMAPSEPPRADHDVRRDEGATAVEFAIVAQVLFLFIFGILGFGIVVAQNLALENGARAAARAGVVDGATCADIKDAAANASSTLAQDGAAVVSGGGVVVAMSDGGVDLCTSDAIVPCSGADAGASLFVTTSTTSSFLGIIPFVDLGDLDLAGRGVVACEAP